VHQTATSSTLAAPSAGLLSTRRGSLAKDQQSSDISVHLADCEVMKKEASLLLNRMYQSRGYGSKHQLADGKHCAVFTSCTDNDVVGTLTLTVDSEAGLATDHTFSIELNSLREEPGTRLCDLTKFAVDPDTSSPAVLAALFHVILLYGMQVFGCTDVVIEVHPRHTRYYEAMIGFVRVGDPKIDESVEWWPSDTPVQLMRLNLRDMRRRIECTRAGVKANSRSLYPHFFSQEEELGIADRIARLCKVDDEMIFGMPRSTCGRLPAEWRAAA
jgi:hypothetical protein